jgi:hypothetical protein
LQTRTMSPNLYCAYCCLQCMPEVDALNLSLLRGLEQACRNGDSSEEVMKR